MTSNYFYCFALFFLEFINKQTIYLGHKAYKKERKKKSHQKGSTNIGQQELEVGLRSRPYLLVFINCIICT